MARSERGGGPRPKAKVAVPSGKAEESSDAAGKGAEASAMSALMGPFRAGSKNLGGVVDAR